LIIVRNSMSDRCNELYLLGWCLKRLAESSYGYFRFLAARRKMLPRRL